MHTARMTSKRAAGVTGGAATRTPRPLPQDTADDPPIPWQPLARGELQSALAGSDAEYAAALRRAEPVDTTTPIRTRALAILSANLRELESIARDTWATAQERTSALAQIARIADAYSADSPTALSARPLCSMTVAELGQRVAECDTRRAQLLARIAAGERADPAGGGGT